MCGKSSRFFKWLHNTTVFQIIAMYLLFTQKITTFLYGTLYETIHLPVSVLQQLLVNDMLISNTKLHAHEKDVSSCSPAAMYVFFL